jgi:DNA invertase Pin-like site-specific DNA recombinase
MLIGYRRSSTVEQQAGFEEQEKLLLATGCNKIFSEMVSSVSERAQLLQALDWVREGDALVVTQLDRLARSTADLLSIISQLEAKGVGLRVLNFGGTEINTKSPTGKMLVTMFGAVAEFERALMLERQKVGIAKAKADGLYKGRAPTARAKAPEMQELEKAGLGARAIALRLGVSRASVYRILSNTRAAA